LTNTVANYNQVTSYNDKINYEGELTIARFIYRLIEATDTKGRLAFSKNNETGFQNLQTNLPGISSRNFTGP
jgi:hypothetical protein